ncbi:MAG TPA: 2-oxoacid:acceptor oxidoreductase subunit alpha [Sulfurovum sp.]|uniref:2-oxoacid:acceptor oxidoreductase subunit alpha n=1 Tax=Sulfurovum sp. TaxID=1969726 RepID=UPI002F929548
MSHVITVSISGSGGSGAVTAGSVLLKGMANAGFYGHLSRFSGPQIRGGESAVIVNFSDHPVEYAADASDLHFAFDWRGFERFGDEIPLDRHSRILYDTAQEALPESLEKTGAAVVDVPLHQEVKHRKGSHPSSFAIGIIAAQIGLPYASLEKAVQQLFGKKGEAFVSGMLDAVRTGFHLLETKDPMIKHWQPEQTTRWNISGNEACALGALRGGIKFVAAYPITPASDIVEYLAPRIEQTGGNVLIAEDELAAMNMVIGSSFGGKPSMTATSGPGFSLMTEAMGLAIASETPALVINVMRGGPSTGLPTKSEQTDLNQALFGMHGEAPHVVLAPLSIADCVLTTQWAVGLAEALQTLVVLLSDQRLGQSRAIIDAVPSKTFGLKRKVLPEQAQAEKKSYERYGMTADHVTPMAIPGNTGECYTADGLEHTVTGKPSSAASDHQQQLEKRSRKITRFAYGEMWAEIVKAPKGSSIAVLTWGSAFANVKKAVLELNSEGYGIDLIALRLLMPLQADEIWKLSEEKLVIVIEQSHSGQLYHYCLGQGAIDRSAVSLAKPGPLVLKTTEIKDFIREVSA